MRGTLFLAHCFLVLGCRDASAPDLQQLHLMDSDVGARLTLSARLGGDSVAFLVAHNATNAADSILYGACAFAARIYTGPGFTHDAWQSVPREPLPCIMPLYIVHVAAGDSSSIVAARFTPQPAIDAPPPYGEVRVYIVKNGQMATLVAGIRDVAVPQP
jgi:hypothetical protein